MKPITAVVTALALSFASCSSLSIRSNQFDIPADARVSIGRITFEHASYERRDDAEWFADVQAEEPAWRGAIESGFQTRARALGLDAGAGPEVDLHVRVTDVEPGSQGLRFWVWFGAGVGTLHATVESNGHGDATFEGSVNGGLTGGDIVTVFRDLGNALANRVAESRDRER